MTDTPKGQVSPKLLAALTDIQTTADKFKDSEGNSTSLVAIAAANDGNSWTDDKGNTLTKNSQDSYSVAGPNYQ